MALVAFAACSPRNAQELVGTWTSTGESMQDTLTLASDHTYVQYAVRSDTGERTRYVGKWTYSDGTLTLEGELLTREWITGTTNTRPAHWSGLVSLPAERWFGPLMLGSDEGIQYIRAH